MKRRESREVAFLLLFEWSFRDEEMLEGIIDLAKACRSIEVDEFAATLAEKTISYAIQLDALIGKYSDKWKLSRLSRVTLAVLRMSICELSMMENIPAGATINEAVELMKKYATPDEASYVNGVLGAFNRSLEAGIDPMEAAAQTILNGESQVEAAPAEEPEPQPQPQPEPASDGEEPGEVELLEDIVIDLEV